MVGVDLSAVTRFRGFLARLATVLERSGALGRRISAGLRRGLPEPSA